MTEPKGPSRRPAGPYSAELKAAILAARLAGASVADVARTYQVSESTVKRWQRAARQLGVTPGVTPQNTEALHADLGEALGGLVLENLATLRAIAVGARAPAYLRAQPADDLAVLYGVIADKTIRVLEAFQRAEAVPEDPAR